MRIKIRIIIFCVVTFLLSFFCVQGISFANPTCVVLKFTDDTRFKQVDTAGTLSDLVMEKLINSGKFNFKETKVIDSNLEQILYDENAANMNSLSSALANGNYSSLFEGAGFSEDMAQTIATAQLGQFVNPDIIQKIGQQHNADYIIQGTIVNLGRGAWADGNINSIMGAINVASGVAGMNLGGLLGPMGGFLGGVNVEKAAFGVQCDLRIIKVDTGEVIWKKQVTGNNTKAKVSLGVLTIGNNKVNSEMYYKAVEDASTQLSDALTTDDSLIRMLEQ